MEQELQQHAQQLRSLEGERTALEGELTSLRDRLTQEQAHCEALDQDRIATGERRTEASAIADRHGDDFRHGAAAAEQARLLVRETRDREARELVERRTAEDDLARRSARRAALEALERDRVGLAPAATALLAQKGRFGDAVVGPLADWISSDGDAAELAEQLLGDFIHAVLVRDRAAVAEIQAWHASEQPGTLILLPIEPGPAATSGAVDPRLHVDSVAAPWVAALTGGSEVLDAGGHALRRPNGAVFLTGPAAATGPIRRRAELQSLVQDLAATTAALATATQRTTATAAELVALEHDAAETVQASERLREADRQAVAVREDLARRLTNLDRELGEARAQLERLGERLTRAEQRRTAIEAAAVEGTMARTRLDEALVTARARLVHLEAEQETARDDRAQWQVQEAHVTARLRGANDAIARAERVIADAQASGRARTDEIAQLDADQVELESQRVQWQGGRDERATQLAALETAAGEAEAALQAADVKLATTEADLASARTLVESMSEEHHRLELGVADATAMRSRIVERVETEWKRPFEELVDAAPALDLDLETLESEAARIVGALEAIGPVNALAVEEHAEESKRAAFLQAQRDDLVAARQALLQAIKEIDGTARALFMETFEAARTNFTGVFQTLFGGGECDLRLSDPDDPLEAEIEIHAAPRGKRTQRIHLLSSGERTLVAVSLLFSIYLTKPNPFCLMDEVDAPLDDANVGRFLRLLDEFKAQTQFLVITHNPRTMQAADSVYGVTMQEPGVSTVVGVRLGDHVGAA